MHGDRTRETRTGGMNFGKTSRFSNSRQETSVLEGGLKTEVKDGIRLLETIDSTGDFDPSAREGMRDMGITATI